MPQITNTTNKDIWFGQIGETIPANGYINTDLWPVTTSTSSQTTSATVIPAGLTINTTLDTSDPILFYGSYSSSQTVAMPQAIVPRTSYTVKLFVSSGTMAVQFNSATNTSFTIPTNDTFEIKCQSRTIDNIVLTGSGTIYITVRKS